MSVGVGRIFESDCIGLCVCLFVCLFIRSITQAWFPFKRNRLRCVRCVSK